MGTHQTCSQVRSISQYPSAFNKFMANKSITYEIGILPVKEHGVSHGPQ